MDYKNKYFKYKIKYMKLKNKLKQKGGEATKGPVDKEALELYNKMREARDPRCIGSKKFATHNTLHQYKMWNNKCNEQWDRTACKNFANECEYLSKSEQSESSAEEEAARVKAANENPDVKTKFWDLPPEHRERISPCNKLNPLVNDGCNKDKELTCFKGKINNRDACMESVLGIGRPVMETKQVNDDRKAETIIHPNDYNIKSFTYSPTNQGYESLETRPNVTYIKDGKKVSVANYNKCAQVARNLQNINGEGCYRCDGEKIETIESDVKCMGNSFTIWMDPKPKSESKQLKSDGKSESKQPSSSPDTTCDILCKDENDEERLYRTMNIKKMGDKYKIPNIVSEAIINEKAPIKCPTDKLKTCEEAAEIIERYDKTRTLPEIDKNAEKYYNNIKVKTKEQEEKGGILYEEPMHETATNAVSSAFSWFTGGS